MVNYREIIRLKSMEYSNRRTAASIGSSRNTVSEVWSLVQEKAISWPIPETLTNQDIEHILYPDRILSTDRKLPDFEYMHKELAKPGVTLTLLWTEYCESCKQEHVIPYQHSQFNEKYRAYAASKKATLRIKRKPGELMEVDWAGTTSCIYDQVTGEIIPAYIFAACLPCSLYSYAEAFPNMKSENWLKAHIHALSHFCGVPRIIAPDNCKTAVLKNTRKSMVLNRSYHEMAEHYGSAVIPARPFKPKDKAAIEGTIGVISTWIIAALRNEKFFSFAELNDAIHEKLSTFNKRPFQKKPGSRQTAFEEEEKAFLMPLPDTPYETSLWQTATIQPDYLVDAGGCKYSVPHEFIGKSVDIRLTDNTVEVFYHGNRIASHIRVSYTSDPIYAPEHMPENHKRYLSYNADSFLEWGQGVGTSTHTVIASFLNAHKTQQQGYKSCASLMKLGDRYSLDRLEVACERALTYTPAPSLKNITTILKNGQDKVCRDKPGADTIKGHGITRGASYYKKGGQR